MQDMQMIDIEAKSNDKGGGNGISNSVKRKVTQLLNVFDSYSGQHVFQISHPLKIPGHGLLRDWAATTLEPLGLRKCAVEL
ncbi:hypothetical protein TNCV_4586301 [Trichonephila clavipes]|nr:hypothetical protein TNCV_4586301 [Trichonephila clavipes]